ncbi:hypothetical protein NIIDNTM18_52100 [Mycolicibacterium litorale]|uniref:Tetratricopeptide repeat protein n=1 Tax=Mycolicibacterium litorale TaxID=758802 RepID=A0A6S6PCW0_9MYCO|nr:hypothetical protein NIIDNTM18_52100 [Mycolicibacterium litorale]
MRRRLLILSAPAALVAVLLAVKLLSVVFAGNAAVRDYADRDADALATDAAVLGVVDIVEPAKAPFVAGTAAVLERRLDDADALFTEALARTPAAESCPVRVNLALVRERRGDDAAFVGRNADARGLYTHALDIVAQAPASCFAGNTDPDEQRRAVRADTAPRLQAKIDGLRNAPPVAPPPPPPPPPPPLRRRPPVRPATARRRWSPTPRAN